MKLTKSDIDKKRERIKTLRHELERIQNERKSNGRYDKEDVGFSYYPEQIMYSERVATLLKAIEKEEADIRDADLIDEFETPQNIIGVGDTVTLLLQYGNEEPIEQTLLVSDTGDLGMDFISTNSPIGLAIYGKEVGTNATCRTPNGILKITILGKTCGLKR